MAQKTPAYLKVPDANVYKRTIIVGDIHGCFNELKSLLDQIKFSGTDLLISVGDLVDRGPDPWSVAEFFKTTSNAYSVLGNHERRIAGIIRGTSQPAWTQRHSLSKLPPDEYGSWAQYFESLPAVIETNRVIVSHARLDPGKEIDNQNPYYTCAVGGSAVEIETEAGVPAWFNKWIEHFGLDKPICIGHLSYPQVEIVPGKLFALDTGVAKAGLLTALILPEFEIKRVNNNKNYYDESYLEWLKMRLLAVPVDKQPIRTMLNIIKNDHPHSIEVKAIKRFNDYVADLKMMDRILNLRQKLAVILGEPPPPGPERGVYFLTANAEFPSNVKKLGRRILSVKPLDADILLKMYEDKTLANMNDEFGQLETWTRKAYFAITEG